MSFKIGHFWIMYKLHLVELKGWRLCWSRYKSAEVAIVLSQSVHGLAPTAQAAITTIQWHCTEFAELHWTYLHCAAAHTELCYKCCAAMHGLICTKITSLLQIPIILGLHQIFQQFSLRPQDVIIDRLDCSREFEKSNVVLKGRNRVLSINAGIFQ